MKKLKDKSLRVVGRIFRTTNSRGDIKYKQYNLQKGQYMFLTRICENPQISFIDLSNLLKVDKTTTTKAVQKLIELNYVKKEQDLKDKRGFKLSATEEGIKIYQCIIEEENRQLDMCFKDFTEDERKNVYELLTRMSENLEEYWDECKK